MTAQAARKGTANPHDETCDIDDQYEPDTMT